MNEKNSFKLRAVVLSLVAIFLCLVLIVGATVALFTDKVTIHNHLQAGNLDVTLIRTTCSYDILDGDGYLTTVTAPPERQNIDAEMIDNAFDLPTDALIVPGSKLSATFKISNNSTVAFSYSITLVAFDSEGNQLVVPSTLLKQLSVKVKDSAGENTLASDATKLEVNGIKTIRAKNAGNVDEESFTVDVEFLDDASQSFVNNDAMNKVLKFDLIVNATQSTTRPSA